MGQVFRARDEVANTALPSTENQRGRTMGP
jgi:hypothetical protein